MAKIISRHGFGLGHAYETAQPSSPQEYLDIALRTEKFVTKYAHKMEDGIYWKKSGPGWRGDPADIDLSLYSGSAGVLYFYLKLQEATGDSIYLETIREGTRYIAAHWRDFFDQTPVFGDMDLRGSEYGVAIFMTSNESGVKSLSVS